MSSIRSTGREPLLLSLQSANAGVFFFPNDLHGNRQVGTPVGGRWGCEGDAAWHVLLKSVAEYYQKNANAETALSYHVLGTS
jgi:hypothetical protein